MKKLGKIVFVCFLCIGMINSNERLIQAVEEHIFTAYIEIGGRQIETTFKVLSEENGTVQIGDGWNTAIDESTGGAMIIPEVVKDSGTGKSYDVTDIGGLAFADCTSLKSTGLESNNTVTKIEGLAFADCTSLESTGLESNTTVQEIEWGAFRGCTSLTSTGLSANSKVTNIGDFVFYGCTNLTTFIFKNNSIPTMGTNTFPSSIKTYYFEGATGVDNLNGYHSTEIKVDSIDVVGKTYHEGEAFTPNGLKFRIGYSKTSSPEEEVSDIVDYDNNESEFVINDVLLKSGINEIDVEYLNEQVTLTLDVEAHTYGEWIIDKEATISEDGEKHTLCSICNNKKIESIPMIDESSYNMISGSNQTWQKGSKNNLVFTIDAKIEKFEGIRIDGKTINKDMYSVKSGSTIIELKREHLNTLNKGNHEIVFVFKEKEVKTSLEVVEAAVIDNKIPDTGDQTNISLYMGMMILAIGGCIWFKKGRS